MDLRSRLLAVVEPLPEGAAVTLPVEIVRSWLAEDAGVQGDVDLTVPQVAALLERAASTVRTWCAEGRLPGAYRLRGREWRIPRAALRSLRDAAPRALSQPNRPVLDLDAWRKHTRGSAR